MIKLRLHAASVILAVNMALGQSVADKPQFEVVSVKRSQPGARGSGYDLNPGRMNGKNQTLRDLVRDAFHVQDYQVSGGPGWADADRYDIAATFPADTTDDQRRRMMQSMLATRFGLTIHRESKDVSGYALVAAKDGPRLKTAESGPHSMVLGRNPAGERTLDGTSVTTTQLAAILATFLGQPVADQTGLNGLYDLTMEWSPDETQNALRMPPGKEAPVPLADGPAGPSLFTAIQKTLGLTLKGQKLPMEVIVIDNAQKPEPN